LAGEGEGEEFVKQAKDFIGNIRLTTLENA